MSAVSAFTSDLEKLERDLNAVEKRLAELPHPTTSGANGRGFHSEYLSGPNQPASVTIDMYTPQMIDTVVLVPAATGGGQDVLYGYGFPKRYRVVGSLDGKEWTTLIEASGENVSDGPVIHEIEPTEIRYLRIIPVEHWQRAEGLYVFALSELMAFEKQVNHALQSRVLPSSTLTIPPRWAPFYLCDGISILGMPFDPTDQLEVFGYRSSESDSAETEKWVQVDLGTSCDIREVQVAPAAPPNEVSDFYGFPAEFSVELCDDPEFPHDKVLTSQFARRKPYNAGAAVFSVATARFPSHRARYVRVRSIRLSRIPVSAETSQSQGGQYAMVMAEVQVIEDSPDGKNLARGRPVTTSDGDQAHVDDHWAPSALTDGFVCQGRLVPIRDFLDRQIERTLSETRRKDLQEKINSHLQSIQSAWSILAMSALGLVAFVALASVHRQRKKSLRQIHELRQQIARDLHDEIGSSLATIRIATELAATSVTDEKLKEELFQIRDLARDAGSSMRDIVWLVSSENAPSTDLIKHLTKITRAMMPQHDVTIHRTENWQSPGIPIEYRRNIVFAFKETLANIVKHADAKCVDIRFVIDYRFFSFQVDDDGVGMPTLRDDDASHDVVNSALVQSETPSFQDEAIADSTRSDTSDMQADWHLFHHGHANLNARALDGGGQFRIGRSPKSGTQVFWSTRIP